jgi:subtilisin family serine protease
MKLSPRRAFAGAGALILGGSVLTTAPAFATTSDQQSPARTVLVLAQAGASDAAVRSAVASAGGSVVKVNGDVGLYTVSTSSASFGSTVRASGAVAGLASDRVIGRAPQELAKRQDVENLKSVRSAAAAAATPAVAAGTEPLASLQWDMDMIHAPEAHAIASGTGKGVRVGIMDTGVDGSHPDIAPNFNATLSRNFTVDDPIIDGPCAEDPDGSCNDPANVDENGHGTHVAGTIASPINGLGIAGVAPDAEIVNLRAGQDSGYFFLQPTVDALTYAAKIGIDVVNMSFYIDPWLYNCTANPADSAEEQLEQRTIIEATERALKLARQKGVTLVAAAGNEHTDLNRPTSDDTSPDYPPDSAHPRTIDNSCLSMPAQGKNVVAVSALGPSQRKAYYSNWGTEEITVSAPGGDYNDFPGTPAYRTPGNLILAPYPTNVGIAEGTIDPVTGDITPNGEGFVIKDCSGGTCAYYQYIQGTSMAAPHVVGVVALIVGRWGHRDNQHGGLELAASQAENILERTAADHACPIPSVYDYPILSATYNSNCDGSTDDNGWYGEGIVNALTAVTTKH